MNICSVIGGLRFQCALVVAIVGDAGIGADTGARQHEKARMGVDEAA